MAAAWRLSPSLKKINSIYTRWQNIQMDIVRFMSGETPTLLLSDVLESKLLISQISRAECETESRVGCCLDSTAIFGYYPLAQVQSHVQRINSFFSLKIQVVDADMQLDIRRYIIAAPG